MRMRIREGKGNGNIHALVNVSVDREGGGERIK